MDLDEILGKNYQQKNSESENKKLTEYIMTVEESVNKIRKKLSNIEKIIKDIKYDNSEK